FLDEIRLGLADLEVERGHVASALEALKSLEVSLEARGKYQTRLLGAVKQRIGSAYLENLDLDHAGKNSTSGSEIFEALRADPATLSGADVMRNKQLFAMYPGERATAGHDQAHAILAHEVARAAARSSQAGLQATERRRIFSGDSLEKNAAERAQLYSGLLKDAEKHRHDSYEWRQQIVEIKRWLGSAMAESEDPIAEDALRDLLRSGRELDDEVNKAAPKDGKASAPENAAAQFALLGSQIELARFLTEKGNFASADEQYRDAREIAEYWTKAAPGFVRWQDALAKIYGGLGDVQLARNDLDQARDSYQSALEIREKLGQPETSSGKRLLDLAVAEFKLASLGEVAGHEPNVVEDRRRRAIAILMQLRAEGRLPPVAQVWPELFGRTR